MSTAFSGVAVLPETAYFEFIAQAAKAHGLAQQLHIRDLVMLRPLVVPDGECRTIQLALEQSGDHLRVTIRAGKADDPSSFAVHVEARLAVDLRPPLVSTLKRSTSNCPGRKGLLMEPRSALRKSGISNSAHAGSFSSRRPSAGSKPLENSI